MLTELLLVGGWIFWVVLGIVLVVEICILASDDDDRGLATAIAVVALLAIILFTDAFKGAKIFFVLPVVGLYLAAGVGWSIKKWYDFVSEKRNVLWVSYQSQMNSSNAKPWADYATSKPTAAQHKQRLITWMSLWPFSFTWWAITWPRRWFSWLYARLTTLFDRISDKVFAG